MATVVAIKNIRTRPPEHGRIRFGEKYVARNGKPAMRATDTWRFTSPDREAIEQLAEQYGGEAKTWHDPKASPQNQFEVQTEASRIQVWLPEDAYSCSYEQWGGKGVERRCDGEVCTFYGAGQRIERPCVCADQPVQTCKPYSRVNLIMPAVNFGGVWRLEVKGKAFMHEAPGMISTIQQMQTTGLARVDLLLTKRTSRDDTGRPQHFMVPQFTVGMTPEQMLLGGAQVQRQAIGAAGSQRALTASPVNEEEVTEGEVVEVVDPRWHEPAVDDADEVEDAELVDQLERSIQAAQAKADGPEEEEDGWDIAPPHLSVMRNPDKDGPRWVRKR